MARRRDSSTIVAEDDRLWNARCMSSLRGRCAVLHAWCGALRLAQGIVTGQGHRPRREALGLRDTASNRGPCLVTWDGTPRRRLRQRLSARSLAQLRPAHLQLVTELFDVVAQHTVGPLGLQARRVHRIGRRARPLLARRRSRRCSWLRGVVCLGLRLRFCGRGVVDWRVRCPRRHAREQREPKTTRHPTRTN